MNHSALASPLYPSLPLLELLAQLGEMEELLQQQLQRALGILQGKGGASPSGLSADMLAERIKQGMGLSQRGRELLDLHRATWPEDISHASRLDLLIARFDLNDVERNLLLLSLLPALDSRYGLWFARLQGGEQKKSLTLEGALTLLCPDVLERIAQESCLLPDAPLIRHGLLQVRGKSGKSADLNENTPLQIDRAIFHFLLGHDYMPPALAPCCQWLAPIQAEPDDHPQFTRQLTLCLQETHQGQIPLLLLRGRLGSGRAAAIARAGGIIGLPSISLDVEVLPDDDIAAWQIWLLALRETKLRASCLVIRSLHTLAESRKALFAQCCARLHEHALPVVCLIEPHSPLLWLGELPHMMMTLPARSVEQNVTLLKAQLQPLNPAPGLDLAALIKRYPISPDTLPCLLQEADLYRQHRHVDAVLSHADLHQALKLRSQQSFGKLAQRIEPVRNFDDLIVSEELMQQLKEIRAAIRHREHALGQGFDRKMGYGFGISALFFGDSGTGKTMAAEVLAGALGVDLIKVDLSTVVNKYIGETEKNLSKIFDLAEADSGVLFFDEADALFGKRSTVKDAQDRHANIEVSYLLQRLENYPGLVILSTNNRSHLDPAFNRRLTFITRFAFPDAALRERMWRHIWPEKVALADEVDFAQLAIKAELTGANIRNIALLATWLAAEEQAGCITLAHIEQGMKRELNKIGRIAA